MAAVSRTSTPSTASSPVALAPMISSKPPPLLVKPIAAAPCSVPLTTGSLTSREWVIPPRPKPGRKPATDTPPTKRKAQNRAAQRAFRERRAARVGELEEQLKMIEEDNERSETKLNAQIVSQAKQLEDYANEISWWKTRCRSLEDELIIEKSAKDTAINELRAAENARNKPQPKVIAGCSNCSPTRCQCIDDAFSTPNTNTQTRDEDVSSKRPNLISSESISKRQRSDPEIKPDTEELEIDFTSRFSFRLQSHRHSQSVSPVAMIDPCGFCQDGTPCICAEMAAEQAEENSRRQSDTTLPSIKNFSQFTPPPSEGDVLSESASIKKPNPCINGPGTCAQCLSDPRSTAFCKSLAASRTPSAGADSGCCGGKDARGGGCCRSEPPRRPPTSAPSITLSCADTFTTLSRHPKFANATDELSTWLPRLNTLPSPLDMTPDHRRDLNIADRPVMEVEAASVMGVLRYFDRRFADK
ncbi:hypothetical protein FQN57_001969 [Myotisia sp. PD_48]|nr:hypothetical protein FQN57_001969 [Myotisia sp. PD_48]